MLKDKRILVLFGGQSGEHEVSCRSAYTVITALEELALDFAVVGISKAGEWLRFAGPYEEITAADWVKRAKDYLALQELSPEPRDLASPSSFVAYHAGFLPDLILPIVHGINCEDGSLQGFLELTKIPYLGSRVLASALAMDKSYQKLICAQAGIPQLPYLVISKEEFYLQGEEFFLAKISKELGLPAFIKPANGGSSLGTAKLSGIEGAQEAFEAAFSVDEKIIVEPFCPARELEVAVLGNTKPQAAQPGEILKPSNIAYYDYANKYETDEVSLAIPASISPELTSKLQSLALEVYQLLNCRGLARVDFFYEESSGEIYLNELNTLPGFTSISLYPQAWAKEGLSLSQLLTKLMELALAEFGQETL